MSPGVASTEKQAELLKDQGNMYFKKERLGAAIEAYTEAITLCPLVPVYWTNRALCHRKRNEWERVESDCRRALELDKESVKGHYMLGLALLQRQQFREAVMQLEKALELGRGGKPGSYMVEEIWQELGKARYREWEQAATVRQRRQKDLKEFCEKLMKADYERKFSQPNDSNTASNNEPSVVIDGVIHRVIDLDDDESDVSESEPLQDEARDKDGEGITELYARRLDTLREVFDKAGAPDRPAEVPDHLCCKITMDIFRDPVITPSGVTYERATLLEHLRKVGKFDPLTRAPLSSEQLVPNLAMKEAVQAYLDNHGWAYRTY